MITHTTMYDVYDVCSYAIHLQLLSSVYLKCVLAMATPTAPAYVVILSHQEHTYKLHKFHNTPADS